MLRRNRKKKQDLLEMSQNERVQLTREARKKLIESAVEAKLQQSLSEAGTLMINGIVVYDDNQQIRDFHISKTKNQSHPSTLADAKQKKKHLKLKRLKITSLNLGLESAEPCSNSPSSDKAKQQISDRLEDSEISWISEFLNHKGEKFTDRMWSLSQKDFIVLETLCKENLRTARKNIMREMRPYTPTDELLKTIENIC